MSDCADPEMDACPPPVYQIRLDGHLDGMWQDWFDGLTMTLEGNGVTLLSGRVIDQPALHGLLKKVRDLGIPLVSVRRVEPDEAGGPDSGP